MFNNNSYSTKNTMNISAVSGSIQKSHKKSFMKLFHMKSELSDEIFALYGDYSVPKYRGKNIHVLQIMCMSNDCLLAEIVYIDDFEEKSE